MRVWGMQTLIMRVFIMRVWVGYANNFSVRIMRCNFYYKCRTFEDGDSCFIIHETYEKHVNRT